MAGIKQKSVQQKKLEGTYRKDRDGENNLIELELAKTAIPESTTPIKVPSEIKTKSIKEMYKEHYTRLVHYGLLLPTDLIEFQQIYIYAQQIHDLNQELKKQDITTDNGLERYQHLTYVILKISARLSDLAKRYYISPVARAKMTLDQLEINKKQNENNNSVIGNLINKAKEV